MTAHGRIVRESLFAHDFEEPVGIFAVDAGVGQQRQREFPPRVGGLGGHGHLTLARQDQPVIVEKPQFEFEAPARVLFAGRPEPAVFPLSSPLAPDLIGVIPENGGIHHIFKVDIALDAGRGIDDLRQSHLQHRRNRNGGSRNILFHAIESSSSAKPQLEIIYTAPPENANSFQETK